MAVAHLLPQASPPQPRTGDDWLAPVIPLRPAQRVADDAARAAWDAAVAAEFEHHRASVRAEAMGILRSAELAEDVVQDVFLRFWQHPERFDADRGSVRRYLCTVARGRSIDVLRSEVQRHRREERTGRRPVEAPDLADPAERVVTAEAVRRAIDTLPAHEAAAVRLAYLQDLTYRQTADALGIPEGTVKTRIRSAFARLRDTLPAPATV